MKGNEHIHTTPPPVYAIWAEARPDGPLNGASGFLCENRKCLFFSKQENAEQKIHDLNGLCLNKAPAAVYKCVEYNQKHSAKRFVFLEKIKEHDLLPDFDPSRYEIRSRIYGNTGGGCMVGTLEVYLPDLDKTVWLNCNEEGVTITSADYVWNEDRSESWDRYEDVVLVNRDFQDTQIAELTSWVPMIHDGLRYIISQKAKHSSQPSQLPAAWLPEEFRQKIVPALLERLLQRNAVVELHGGGRMILCDKADIQAEPNNQREIKFK